MSTSVCSFFVLDLNSSIISFSSSFSSISSSISSCSSAFNSRSLDNLSSTEPSSWSLADLKPYSISTSDESKPPWTHAIISSFPLCSKLSAFVWSWATLFWDEILIASCSSRRRSISSSILALSLFSRRSCFSSSRFSFRVCSWSTLSSTNFWENALRALCSSVSFAKSFSTDIFNSSSFSSSPFLSIVSFNFFCRVSHSCLKLSNSVSIRTVSVFTSFNRVCSLFCASPNAELREAISFSMASNFFVNFSFCSIVVLVVASAFLNLFSAASRDFFKSSLSFFSWSYLLFPSW